MYPHCAFTHSVKHHWHYVICTMESVGTLFQPFEEVIYQHFLPALTGWIPSSEIERDLLSLLCPFGGLNIPKPSCSSDLQLSSPRLMSASIASHINKEHWYTIQVTQ